MKIKSLIESMLFKRHHHHHHDTSYEESLEDEIFKLKKQILGNRTQGNGQRLLGLFCFINDSRDFFSVMYEASEQRNRYGTIGGEKS